MYTIKSSVIAKYVGDSKVNSEMKAALVDEYNKYQLYRMDSCINIMKKAMSCKSVVKFVKYAEQLEDEMKKQFELWKVLEEEHNKQLDKELYDADE